VERPVGIELVRAEAGGPEALARAAHVPVREPIDEIEERLRRGEDLVGVERAIDGSRRQMKLRDDPAIEERPLAHGTVAASPREGRGLGVRCALVAARRIEAVDVRVDEEEAE